MQTEISHKRNWGFLLLPYVGLLSLILSCSLLAFQSANATQVTLDWAAETGASGYKIYYGTTSKNYSSVIDVGNAITYTVPNLSNGVTYYFAATAYDANRLESDYSSEVSYNPQIDVFWRNNTTGQNYVWYVSGVNITAGAPVSTVTDLNWKAVATGDFNSDGHPDILWRNSSTGLNYIWYMNGAAMIGGAYFGGTVSTDWQIAGVGDFNSDGHPDILWRNTSTGQNYIWYMNGVTATGGGNFGGTVSTDWQIVRQ